MSSVRANDEGVTLKNSKTSQGVTDSKASISRVKVKLITKDKQNAKSKEQRRKIPGSHTNSHNHIRGQGLGDTRKHKYV